MVFGAFRQMKQHPKMVFRVSQRHISKAAQADVECRLTLDIQKHFKRFWVHPNGCPFVFWFVHTVNGYNAMLQTGQQLFLKKVKIVVARTILQF
jgi:hypothetical protein